ncbi:MAG TPA: hypothetical protein VLA98_04890, partial [Solirubrobacteraceae bacterium]|nr:hypothetical protein [Solirubrobacteraceae bacterium]
MARPTHPPSSTIPLVPEDSPIPGMTNVAVSRATTNAIAAVVRSDDGPCQPSRAAAMSAPRRSQTASATSPPPPSA